MSDTEYGAEELQFRELAKAQTRDEVWEGVRVAYRLSDGAWRWGWQLYCNALADDHELLLVRTALWDDGGCSSTSDAYAYYVGLEAREEA